MVDGVAITAGSGTTVLTDDTGAGGHAQVVKLAISTDGSATLIPAEATNGLDVDVTRVQGDVAVTLAAGATSIAKAEDGASANADVGVPAMAVRKATPANTSDLDGDYEMIQMSAGRLWVSATVDAALPTGSNAIGKLAANSGVTIGAVEIAAGQALAATQSGNWTSRVVGNGGAIVDGVIGAAAAPANMIAVGGVYNSTELSPATGQSTAIQLDAKGRVRNVIMDAAGNSRGVNVTAGNAMVVDGSGVTQPVSGTVTASIAAGATTIAKAEDVASADADVGVPAMAVRKATPANTSGTDGDYEMLQISAGRLWTSATIDAALPAGTNGIGKLTANAGVTIGAVEIASAQTLATLTTLTTLTGGGVANDGVDSGNPVKVGGRAVTATPTAVASGDRADFTTDTYGRQLVNHIDPGQQVWKSANYTTTQTGAIIWAPASGKKIVITSIVIGSYGTTAARLILYLGTAADTTYTAGTDQLVLAASFAPGTGSKPGLVFTPFVPIFAATADHNLHITTDAALSVDLTVYGYEI